MGDMVAGAGLVLDLVREFEPDGNRGGYQRTQGLGPGRAEAHCGVRNRRAGSEGVRISG